MASIIASDMASIIASDMASIIASDMASIISSDMASIIASDMAPTRTDLFTICMCDRSVPNSAARGSFLSYSGLVTRTVSSMNHPGWHSGTMGTLPTLRTLCPATSHGSVSCQPLHQQHSLPQEHGVRAQPGPRFPHLPTDFRRCVQHCSRGGLASSSLTSL